ncbi:MAG: hypothetical protein LBR86_04325, partial [Tannerella sp.]|nr:hypothetical protein [Tannerella sp.]
IADVNGDGSADMVLMGRSNEIVIQANGFIYVVSGKYGDLAPAPHVWNQFHYHPMKINENLQTPWPANFHPLNSDYRFYKDENDPEPTYIYNSNIMQAVISSSFKSAGGKEIIRPILLLPDAKILDAAIHSASNTLTFKLTNTGNAALRPVTPVRVYRDGAPFDLTKTVDSVSSTGVYPGDTVTFTYSITQLASIYDIVVAGTLVDGNLETGSALDCNWADNRETVAQFLLREDMATAAQFGTVVIDVLANDLLTSACNNVQLTPDRITTPGGQGALSGNFGSFVLMENKLLYTAPESYPGGVVTASYKFVCEGVERSANIHIYILENCGTSFGVCAGTMLTPCIKKIPDQVTFEWYDENLTFIGKNPPETENLYQDVTYYVRPVFSGISDSPYRVKSFPPGAVTYSVVAADRAVTTARWTGLVDSNWRNPANWVEVMAEGWERPCSWAPDRCVDVILPSDMPHYPELSDTAQCHNLTFHNRAMLKNPHVLVYDSVRVEIGFSALERDRFVMWSAPLKSMYSGDYLLGDETGRLYTGDVRMNFFQQAHPAPGSLAALNRFTATFGELNEPLPLGRAFNLHVISTSASRNRMWQFPATFESYTAEDPGHTVYSTPRSGGYRLITDSVSLTANTFALPVVQGNGSNAGYELIQVVNPYLAWLRMEDFLTGNSTTLADSYLTWDGRIRSSFTGVLLVDTISLHNGNRYLISSTPVQWNTAGLIAPLQSFFVRKRTPSDHLASVKMSPQWTATTPSGPYLLAHDATAEQQETGVLRIKASQGDRTSHAVLYYSPDAVPGYDGREDISSLFYDEIPLTLYSLTPLREPLLINGNGHFIALPTGLGVRLAGGGEVKLEFSGLETFGHNVYLTDRERNVEINLQEHPEYTFTAPADNGFVETGDRLSLRMEYTGIGLENRDQPLPAPADVSQLVVTGENGSICVRSPDGVIRNIQVYHSGGALVYRDAAEQENVCIPAERGQTYIVHVQTARTQEVRKVWVK